MGRSPPPTFQRLLEEFVDVMNPSKNLSATSHGVGQLLETRGRPLRQPVRRLNAEKLEAAMLEFSQLERNGIIGKYDSPWASS
jgi:hypothetical protein